MTLDAAIAELRSRNRPVPRPARLPTPAEVDAVAAELGVPFPADYRRFLIAASDVIYGTVEPATVVPAGAHTHLSDVARSAWAMGVPADWLPICEDNGDFYCLHPDGRVLYWSHDGAVVPAEWWPSLTTWIEEVWLVS